MMSEPIVLFGMAGCADFKSADKNFYTNFNACLDMDQFFNNMDMSYSGFEKYENYYDGIIADEIMKKRHDQLNQLYRKEHNRTLSPFIVSSSIIFGIFDNETIIAFIAVAKTSNVLLVVEILVDEQYRNNGIGKMLFDHVLNLYKNIPYVLHVSVSNTIAVNMYYKLGFVVDKIIPNYYMDLNKPPYTGDGVNAYYMTRPSDKYNNMISNLIIDSDDDIDDVISNYNEN